MFWNPPDAAARIWVSAQHNRENQLGSVPHVMAVPLRTKAKVE
jgi:hypothetical protein